MNILSRLFRRQKPEEMRDTGAGSIPARILNYDPVQHEQDIAYARAYMSAHSSPPWYAHGTNGNGFDGILKSNGKVLPLNELQKLGKEVVSGEFSGELHPSTISAIDLSVMPYGAPSVLSAIYHAKLVTWRRPRPDEIRRQIAVNRNFLAKYENSPPFPGTSHELEYLGLKRTIPRLERLAERFDGMSAEEKRVWDELGSVPVVLLGQSSDNRSYFLQGGPPGEVLLKSLKTVFVASEPAHEARLRELLRFHELGVNFVPFGALEDLQTKCSDLHTRSFQSSSSS